MDYINFLNFDILYILVTTLLTFILTKKLFNKNTSTNNIENNNTKIILMALQKPCMYSIFLISAYTITLALKPDDSKQLIWLLTDKISHVGLIVLFIWFINRVINGFEAKYIVLAKQNQTMLDLTSIHAIVQIIKIGVLVTGILSIMSVFQIDIRAIVTVGGIGGIGIAFAAKELLANFFGGLLIILDRPFEVGDWIRSPDKDIEGTVEYIGWRLTRIRSFDKRPRYVPNSVFLTLVVENASRMTHRRIKTHFGLRYKDAHKVNKVLADIENMLSNHPEIDANQTLMVKLIAFGESSLDVLVYAFTKTTKWIEFQSVQQDIFVQILEIIATNGAECAFPTRQVHLTNEEH